MRVTKKSENESDKKNERERERERERVSEGNFGRTRNVQEVIIDFSIKVKICFHSSFKYFLINILNLL